MSYKGPDINTPKKEYKVGAKHLYLIGDKDDRILYNRREEIIRKLLSTLDAIKYALSGASLEDTAE